MAYKQPYIPKGLNPGTDYVNLINQFQRLQNRLMELESQAKELELEQMREAARIPDYLEEREISPDLRPETVGGPGGIRDYIRRQREAGETLKFTNVPETRAADSGYFYFQEGEPSERAKGLQRQMAERAEIEREKARKGQRYIATDYGIFDTDEGKYIYEHTGGDPIYDEFGTEVGKTPKKFKPVASPEDFRLPDQAKEELFRSIVGQPQVPDAPLQSAHAATRAMATPQPQARGLASMLIDPLISAGKQFYSAMQEPMAPPPPQRGSYTQGPGEEERALAMQELAGVGRKLGFSGDNPYAPWNLAKDVWGGLGWTGDKMIDALRYLAGQQAEARRGLPAYMD